MTWYRSPAWWRGFRRGVLAAHALVWAVVGGWAFVHGSCVMQPGWRAAGTVLGSVLLLALSMACVYGYAAEGSE